jgi:hypothetical protein
VHHLALLVLFFSITNFSKSLFSFVKEALALAYLSKSWTFLLLVVIEANDFPSSGTLSSSFLSKNLIFLGHSIHVFTLSAFADSSNSAIWVVNAFSAENADILLLSHSSISSCCWLFHYFTVGRGVSEQLQVKFLSYKSLRIISGCLHITFFRSFFLTFLLSDHGFI